MTVLKWVLVIVGVLFLAFIAVILGGYYWASTIEAVHLTRADIEVGGSYPPEERQTLIDACHKTSKVPAGDNTVCACIADKAAAQFSRFERLALTAGFEGSPTRIVALTKGLIDSGIPQAEVDSMQTGSEKRTSELLKACGLEAK